MAIYVDNFSCQDWERPARPVPASPVDNLCIKWISGVWEFGEFARGLTDMTTMPLYWVEYSYLKHPNSFARIVVKTTLLVSFLTVPRNEKQSDWLSDYRRRYKITNLDSVLS